MHTAALIHPNPPSYCLLERVTAAAAAAALQPLCSHLTDNTLQRPLKALLALIAGSLRSNVPVLIVLKCNQHLGSGGANNLNLTEHLRRPSDSGPRSYPPNLPGGTNGFMLCWEEEEVGGTSLSAAPPGTLRGCTPRICQEVTSHSTSLPAKWAVTAWLSEARRCFLKPCLRC